MTIRFLAILALTAPAFLAAPVSAQEAAGPYLATRQARYDSNFVAAAKYALEALQIDATNRLLMESAVGALVAIGEVERALPIAQRMEESEIRSQFAQMVLLGEEVRRGDFAAVLARIKNKHGVSPLADGLIGAWATLGEGDMTSALAQFDKIALQPGLRGLALYHKALALASVGDFEGADQIYAGTSNGSMQITRRSAIAWAEVLSQLERRDDAIKLLDDTFGSNPDPQIMDMRAKLAAGAALEQGRIETPQQGIAEVFLSLGLALLQDTSADYVLLYSRIAEYLAPSDIDAQIMTGELLDQLGRFDLANKAFARVPPEAAAFYTAELGRAESLRRAGDLAGAISIIANLRKSHPEVALVHASAGDLYRQSEEYAKAIPAYDKAIALYTSRGGDEPWFIYYARAIAYERLGEWPEAEADFRHALELNPEQPLVLNYLGYSLIEQRKDLDEALDMIKRADEAEPDNGAIVDSLGWAQFRLGHYDEAVVTLERAAELYAVDPVVNDHLGDAMWAVGRISEARFQWQRALSLIRPDTPAADVDPDRIRKKLAVGLDQVLQDEGAEPIKITKTEG